MPGVGLPLATTVKKVLWPDVIVGLAGCVVMAGAAVSVSVAAVVVAVPTLLVARPRDWLLSSPAVTFVMISAPVVVPAYVALSVKSVNVVPPSVVNARP